MGSLLKCQAKLSKCLLNCSYVNLTLLILPIIDTSYIILKFYLKVTDLLPPPFPLPQYHS